MVPTCISGQIAFWRICPLLFSSSIDAGFQAFHQFVPDVNQCRHEPTMNPSAPDPIRQPEVNIGFEIGNLLARIEAVLTLPDLTAPESDNGKPAIAGNETLGGGMFSKEERVCAVGNPHFCSGRPLKRRSRKLSFYLFNSSR